MKPYAYEFTKNVDAAHYSTFIERGTMVEVAKNRWEYGGLPLGADTTRPIKPLFTIDEIRTLGQDCFPSVIPLDESSELRMVYESGIDLSVWCLYRDGKHVRYLNEFESAFIYATVTAVRKRIDTTVAKSEALT